MQNLGNNKFLREHIPAAFRHDWRLRADSQGVATMVTSALKPQSARTVAMAVARRLRNKPCDALDPGRVAARRGYRLFGLRIAA